MIKNKLVLMGLTGILAVGNVIPAVAAGTVYTAPSTSSKEVGENVFEVPGWIWIGGKCYYYAAGQERSYDSALDSFKQPVLLKSTTTPDGYTVNELGQWTVDGVVQTNDYGHATVGTTDYNGKSDDEIWSLMKTKLKDIWSKAYTEKGDKAFSEYSENTIAGISKANGPVYYAQRNGSGDEFIEVTLAGYWDNQVMSNDFSPQTLAFVGSASQITEKTIKAAIGDNIGQEFFNELKAASDANVGKSGQAVFDENGNPVKEYILYKKDGTAWETTKEEYDYETVNGHVRENPTILKARPELNGGINSEAWINGRHKFEEFTQGLGSAIHTMDLSKWQNRTTDYGKRFSINNNGHIIIYR